MVIVVFTNEAIIESKLPVIDKINVLLLDVHYRLILCRGSFCWKLLHISKCLCLSCGLLVLVYILDRHAG